MTTPGIENGARGTASGWRGDIATDIGTVIVLGPGQKNDMIADIQSTTEVGVLVIVHVRPMINCDTRSVGPEDTTIARKTIDVRSHTTRQKDLFKNLRSPRYILLHVKARQLLLRMLSTPCPENSCFVIGFG